jgi:hypothetical protein
MLQHCSTGAPNSSRIIQCHSQRHSRVPQPDLNSAMLLHNSVPFLRGGPEETTREIIRRSKPLSFKAGNRIYRIGDPDSEMWFVTSGAVRLQ